MNTYQFKSGAKVEGSVEQILAIAKSLGEVVDLSKITGPLPNGFYLSSTHGVMKISDMNEAHIRNALIKRSKEYYENLRKRKLKVDEFMVEYTKLGDDSVVTELFTELASR